jgi:hypothetical protein
MYLVWQLPLQLDLRSLLAIQEHGRPAFCSVYDHFVSAGEDVIDNYGVEVAYLHGVAEWAGERRTLPSLRTHLSSTYDNYTLQYCNGFNTTRI